MGANRGAPAALEDPQLRATGALVATLFTQRRDWVHRHVESVSLRGDGELRRRVTVEVELPAVAWGLVPDGAPAIVPLGLVPKASAADVAVRDEAGARIAVVPADERAPIAAAGLLAIATAAGAGGDAVSGAAWRIAAGAEDEAGTALAELARGESKDARAAWMHPPFRLMAEELAEHVPLLVALPEAGAPRSVTYEYDDRATARIEPAATQAGGLARLLARRPIELRVPLAPLAAAGRDRFEVDAGGLARASAEVDEASGTALVRVTTARSAVMRLAPLAALLAALLLAAEAVAAESLARDPGLFALALAVPVAAAAYLARDTGHFAADALLRGWRALLLALVALCVAGQLMIALDASEELLRAGGATLAALGVGVAALLVAVGRPKHPPHRDLPPGRT